MYRGVVAERIADGGRYRYCLASMSHARSRQLCDPDSALMLGPPSRRRKKTKKKKQHSGPPTTTLQLIIIHTRHDQEQFLPLRRTEQNAGTTERAVHLPADPLVV